MVTQELSSTTVEPVLESSESERRVIWENIKESYEALRNDAKRFAAYKFDRARTYGVDMKTD